MQVKPASAVVIVPKQPFVKWANWGNGISEGGRDQSYEYFTGDCSVVLISKCLTEKGARAHISANWETIFEQQLERYIDRPLWPHNRTEEMFSKWFGVRFHSTVLTCILADKEAGQAGKRIDVVHTME